MEAIASRLEAIATRLEAIASSLVQLGQAELRMALRKAQPLRASPTLTSPRRPGVEILSVDGRK